jgi:hypothetical protein
MPLRTVASLSVACVRGALSARRPRSLGTVGFGHFLLCLRQSTLLAAWNNMPSLLRSSSLALPTSVPHFSSFLHYQRYIYNKHQVTRRPSFTLSLHRLHKARATDTSSTVKKHHPGNCPPDYDREVVIVPGSVARILASHRSYQGGTARTGNSIVDGLLSRSNLSSTNTRTPRAPYASKDLCSTLLAEAGCADLLPASGLDLSGWPPAEARVRQLGDDRVLLAGRTRPAQGDESGRVEPAVRGPDATSRRRSSRRRRRSADRQRPLHPPPRASRSASPSGVARAPAASAPVVRREPSPDLEALLSRTPAVEHQARMQEISEWGFRPMPEATRARLFPEFHWAEGDNSVPVTARAPARVDEDTEMGGTGDDENEVVVEEGEEEEPVFVRPGQRPRRFSRAPDNF